MPHVYPPQVPLSLAHLSELDLPPARLLRAAAAAGFASVGFRTAPAAPGGIAYPLAGPDEQAGIRSLANDTGVSVLYVEMVSLGEDCDLDAARRVLDIGAAVGATRLAVAGDSSDFGLLAAQMAALCDHAALLGMAVDIEFMPFRRVAGFSDAHEVVRRAGRPNGFVLIDALHVHRSGSPVADIAAAPDVIGTFQICDAPFAAPPAADLPTEARTRRLLPGDGGIDLRAVIAALPDRTPLGIEVPLASVRPDLTPEARLSHLVAETRTFLQRETQR